MIISICKWGSYIWYVSQNEKTRKKIYITYIILYSKQIKKYYYIK